MSGNLNRAMDVRNASASATATVTNPCAGLPLHEAAALATGVEGALAAKSTAAAAGAPSLASLADIRDGARCGAARRRLWLRSCANDPPTVHRRAQMRDALMKVLLWQLAVPWGVRE